ISVNQKSRTQKATGQERQASIIAAAASLFAQKGFNGTTTREIARTAGISEALLFRYFPTKRALYAAIIAARSQLSQLMASIEEAAAERDDVQDFLQILGEDDKYAGSVKRIGKRIWELSSVPGLDAQLFFERVLLNFLLGNGDAHLKNFSLLETEDGGLRLSPAYDLVCSKAVIPKETDFAITLNGKADKITRRDFEKFSETSKIP